MILNPKQEYSQKKGKLNDELFLQFFTARKYRVLRHLLLLIFLISALYSREKAFKEPFDTFIKIGAGSFLLLVVYVNMYVLTPKLLLKERYGEYFLGLLLLYTLSIACFLTVRYFIAPNVKPLHENFRPNFDFFAFTFMFTTVNAASATVKLFQRWVADSQRINELETTTIQAELEQLKSQINPHFLFNTLNNANVLTQKDPEKASQVLMKLSDLLRYQLYDSTRNKVILTADIHFLEDFLNLEKIRRDNFEFSLATEGSLTGVLVAPLLFITFVENAVKHNMDADRPSFVHLFFEVKNNELHFKCINSKPEIPEVKNGAGGLGLANVKRRLELLYPERHTLIIDDENNSFTIRLSIKL